MFTYNGTGHVHSALPGPSSAARLCLVLLADSGSRRGKPSNADSPILDLATRQLELRTLVSVFFRRFRKRLFIKL